MVDPATSSAVGRGIDTTAQPITILKTPATSNDPFLIPKPYIGKASQTVPWPPWRQGEKGLTPLVLPC